MWPQRTARSRSRQGGPRDAALRILGERLARGEISIDDYTRRRAVLNATSPPEAPRRYPGRRVALTAAAAAVASAAVAAVAAVVSAAVASSPGAGQPPWAASRPSCTAPALPGQVVDVTLTDMMGGPPYGGGGMMRVVASRASVAAGTVSLHVTNTGALTHELVILPRAPGQRPGSRPVGADGTVSEAGSLGEASATCAAGRGSGIAPGAVSWLTLRLRPGRYDLICNLPGHYAMGMHTELDVG